MLVAVIGSSQWRENLLEDMLTRVDVQPDDVSGGAAGSDHLAVILFLQGKVRGLHLHFPCA